MQVITLLNSPAQSSVLFYGRVQDFFVFLRPVLSTTQNFDEAECKDADDDDDGTDDVTDRGEYVQYEQLQKHRHNELQVLHLSNTQNPHHLITFILYYCYSLKWKNIIYNCKISACTTFHSLKTMLAVKEAILNAANL